MSSLKLTHRLVLAAVLITVAAGVGVGAVSIARAGSSLETEAAGTLTAVVNARVTQLDRYLSAIQEDLQVVAASPTAVDAVTAFAEAVDSLDDPSGQLQRLYITGNPHPAGERDLLADAGDGSSYSEAHARFHPWFNTIQEAGGYYDVFLMDARGFVVYTVFKEPDFATDLRTGAWRSSELAQVFNEVAGVAQPGRIAFRDFKPYAPSNGAPASFMATPILDGNGVLVGVLAVQMPVGRLNDILADAAGLGETGETYLVGADSLMRSDARLAGESTLLKQKVTSASVARALAGETGLDEAIDYRGQDVISAFAPLGFDGTRWAVLAEMDRSEFLAPVRALQRTLALIVLALVAVLAGVGNFVARGVAKPIVELADVASVLAGDDTSVSVPHTGRGDEIGLMGRAVETFKQGLIERRRLHEEAKEAEEAQRREELRRAEEERAREAQALRAREERAAAIEALIKSFEDRVRGVLDAVSSAATELEATATSMATLAETSTGRAGEASDASGLANVNVEAVASASEELSRSITEISKQMGMSREITREAVVSAEGASGLVSELEADVGQIGRILGLISDIAEQTNLLALNATIEAARAGEAGKGFAVVANEVKQLANETAKATGEIEGQIRSVQQRSQGVSSAVGSIRTVIVRTEEISVGVAAAVEQQDAATAEISRSAASAAQSAADVTGSMEEVRQGATETRVAAEQVLGASKELARNGTTLQGVVDDFLEAIRRT